jgi:Osmosensitive K+ channel His kinase sensor domain
MTDARANPDELLRRVTAEERRASRGKLVVFFGAAPGVGKTYAMLEAARSERELGPSSKPEWLLDEQIDRHIEPPSADKTDAPTSSSSQFSMTFHSTTTLVPGCKPRFSSSSSAATPTPTTMECSTPPSEPPSSALPPDFAPNGRLDSRLRRRDGAAAGPPADAGFLAVRLGAAVAF